MKTTHRNYSEETGDFHRLCSFISDNHAFLRSHSTWCLGRVVDWKYGLYENKRAFPTFCDQNAHLWFDGFDRLAGCVISESGDSGFVILTLAGYRFLFEEMLLWALESWQDRGPRFSIEVTEDQEFEIKILEKGGFGKKATFYTQRFDLTRPLVPRQLLEPGFSIVDLHTHPDYRAQRILRADAFQGKSDISDEELQDHLKFYNYARNGPIYHPQADLCVLAVDGQFVSGCEALIDARNAVADIERVCTHSAFRQRGFAKAVILECLYRLKEIGLHSAYITGYSPEAISLYGSLGAVEEKQAFIYETV